MDVTEKSCSGELWFVVVVAFRDGGVSQESDGLLRLQREMNAKRQVSFSLIVLLPQAKV